MHYFLPPKNSETFIAFWSFQGEEKWNIGLISVNYALTLVKPEQERPLLTECHRILRRRYIF